MNITITENDGKMFLVAVDMENESNLYFVDCSSSEE